MVAMLDRALVDAGHRSVVIACEGSQVVGTLIPTELPSGVWNGFVSTNVQNAYRQVIAKAIERYRPDVIHLHGIDFLQYLPPEGVPTVATLHLPPSWYPPAVFSLDRPKTWLHCVSSSQNRDCPVVANLLPTIENGVPEIIRADMRKGNFALTMARICPEKGIDTAIRAAKLAKVPLLIAGEVYPYEAHIRYFEEQVKPLLGQCARFLGPIGANAKRRLLAAAKCVLIASNVSETSSLVAMEAAMSGTPVVAFAMGALNEIVEGGRTGFLVDTEAAMAEAIADCASINPAECRKIARERFTENRAQAEYLRMYQSLARQ